jgi:hypothetical protein
MDAYAIERVRMLLSEGKVTLDKLTGKPGDK